MKFNKSLISSFLLLLASGCASSYYIPSARLLSSESEGLHGASIEGDIREIHRVYLTHDLNGTPITQQTQDLDQSITVGGMGAFGLLESLDVGARYDVDAAPMAFTKFQVFGDSKRKSKPGNFSFSVVVSGGYAGDNTDTSGDFGSSSTLTRNGHGVYEAEGILGYRLNPQVLLLTGASVLWQTISGHQDFMTGAPPLQFHDDSRFTEMHWGSLIYFDPENTNPQRAFITPMLQWGWVDTFGNRFYAFTVQMDVGVQF